jgi:uncharacterized repeat protein (TIGR02543 family)
MKIQQHNKISHKTNRKIYSLKHLYTMVIPLIILLFLTSIFIAPTTNAASPIEFGVTTSEELMDALEFAKNNPLLAVDIHVIEVVYVTKGEELSVGANVYLYIDQGATLWINNGQISVENSGTVIIYGSINHSNNWSNDPGAIVIFDGTLIMGNDRLLQGATPIDRNMNWVVTLDANGGYINGTHLRITVAVPTNPVTSLSSVVSATTTVDRVGYTFIDWRDEDGVVWDFDDAVNDNMLLYAHWVEKADEWATITFESADTVKGTVSGVLVVSGIKGTDVVASYPIVTPAYGYDFDVWSAVIPPKFDNDMTIQATWKVKADEWATITFVNGDATKGTLIGTLVFKGIIGSSTPVITAPDADPEFGYKFAGWDVLSLPEVYSVDMSITGSWVGIPYNIWYDLRGGVNAPGNPSMYSIANLPLSIAMPSREGYTFLNWVAFYADGSVSVLPVSGIPVGTVGDVTLVAVWTSDADYIIHYELNGGVNAPDNPTAYSKDSSFPITIDKPTKVNYEFLGWTVRFIDGSPADIAVPILSFSILEGTTGHVVLTANWKPIQYNITYNLNSGVNAANNPTSYTVESVFPINIANPTRSGYDFLGWNVTYANGNPTATFQISYRIPAGTTGDISLAANWRVIVADDPGGGSNSGGGSSSSGGSSSNKTPAQTTPPKSSPPNTMPPPRDVIIDEPDEEVLPTWALVNLVLSVLGVILAVLAVVVMLLLQRRSGAGHKGGVNKNGFVWLMAAVILGVVGIVVFLLTQDMSGVMVMVDTWTIVHAIIFVVELFVVVFIFKPLFYNKEE